jgi:WD40 repeat protein
MMARWIALLVVLVVSLTGAAWAEEKPPVQAPILRIEAGMHTLSIKKLDLSADGRYMVTGADDKTMRLWSLPDGKLLRIFRVPIGHGDDGKIYAVALSPDGRLAAAGGWDAYWAINGGVNHVYLFDTVSGAVVRRLGPFPNVINDLEFSHNGAKLAVGTTSGNGLYLYDSPFTGRPKQDSDYAGEVYGLSFDSKGRLATVSYDRQIRIYDEKFKLISKRWTPNNQLPFSVAFSPDDTKVAVGYNDVPGVDIFSGQNLDYWYRADTSMVPNGDLFSVAWTADGTQLAAAGRYTINNFDPIIRWDSIGRDGRSSLGGPINTVMDMASLPEGSLVFGAADPAFGIVDRFGNMNLYQGSVIADMRGKRDHHFWISPDGFQAWFGLKQWSVDPVLLDIGKLSFEAKPERPQGLIEPRIDGLKVEAWINDTKPTLDGKPLQLENYETSRSLAIMPDGKSFILGAEWSLYRFNDKGEQVWRKKTEGLNWGVALTGDGQMIVAAQSDGTLRWFSAENGDELLAFFVHAVDKRWIAWTPRGYYAASPGGEDLIGWHVNRSWDEAPDFFPAQQFREQFYRPDIVKLVLKYRDQDEAIREANKLTRKAEVDEEPEQGSEIKATVEVRTVLPPVVELVEDSDEIETAEAVVPVTYRLRSPSGKPVTNVHVLIDGRPITTRAAKPVSEGEEHTVEIPVPPRDVEVSIIAHTADGASVPVVLKVKWKGARTDGPKPRLYAVIVGVSDYERGELKLNFADDDARAFAKMIETQKDRLYSNVEVKLLVDGDATRENINDALTWLEGSTGPNDYAVLFMAGHGVTDPKGRFYFLPVAGDPNPTKLRSTAVGEGDIRDAISLIAGKVLFFIDACHSASALDGGLGVVDATAIVNDLASAENGIVMFSSSTGRELSLEDPAWGHGAFTKALLEGLAGEADFKKDGKLTTAEINLWLTSRVAELTSDRQNAVMVKPRTVKEFALAAVQ